MSATLDLRKTEELVRRLRKLWGIEYEHNPSVANIFEVLLPRTYPGFQFRVVPANELPRAEAFTDAGNNSITARDHVYESAKLDHPHSKMTMLEEMAHRVLQHTGIRYRGDVNRFVASDLRP